MRGRLASDAHAGGRRADIAVMAGEVLDKSAKVEWHYRFQRRADAVVQGLELQLHTGAFATTICRQKQAEEHRQFMPTRVGQKGP